MAEQLLSSDPRAGQLLSADPTAGVIASAGSQVQRDERGRPLVSSDLSDAPAEPSSLFQMLGPLAHPETFTDFARLLTLPVDTVKKAAASALAMAAARPAAGAALHATGTGLEKAGTLIDKPSRYVGAAEVVSDPKRALLTLVAPSTMRATGRLLQRAGTALGETAPAAESATPVSAAAAPVEAASASPAPTGNALPDQKALNAAALAARRAAYAAKQMSEMTAQGAARAGAEPIVPISGQMKLTGPEFTVWQRLVNGGMKYQEAEQAVKDARELADRLGTPTPTIAETKFPKGMRGKS